MCVSWINADDKEVGDMMSFFDRDELKHDAVIMLNNKPCRIINVLGSGTSSIVYRAEMPVCIAGFTCDRAVVLKELYPMGLDIGRKDDMSLDIFSTISTLLEVMITLWVSVYPFGSLPI